jgi:two-component system sensor histidine kinase DesK
MLGTVRHLALGAQDRTRQPSARLIRLAMAAAVLYSLYLPLIRLYGIADEPVKSYSGGQVGSGAAHLGVAAIGLTCFLPLMVWLTLSATRGERRWAERWTLLAVLGIIFAFMPLVGGSWVGMLYAPSALALVLVPVPWNLGLFTALAAVEAVLAGVLGLPTYTSYFLVGTICLGVPLAILIVAIRRARQLQVARQQLADQAVLRERRRINEELRAVFEDRLAAVAQQADRAAQLVATDPARSSAQMRALVGSSRATLADARRLARGYRDGSLRAECHLDGVGGGCRPGRPGRGRGPGASR